MPDGSGADEIKRQSRINSNRRGSIFFNPKHQDKCRKYQSGVRLNRRLPPIENADSAGLEAPGGIKTMRSYMAVDFRDPAACAKRDWRWTPPPRTKQSRERSLGLSGLLALRGVAAQDFALGR